MEKCKHCKFHKSNLSEVYEVIYFLASSGDYDHELAPDFENWLCGNQGCGEPEEKYREKYGDALTREARLKLRRDMGTAEFTKKFPDWAKELEMQDKAQYMQR
jgi:hypothetical protein